jgi:NAD(P)-dependent dehydrogenase (short-subunit alcohol dehydrogenase family)
MKLPENSVAVITGAASGIGRALSIHLAQLGANLAIADINENGLLKTKELAENYGVKITTHKVDVGNKDEMKTFADDVIKEHQRVTFLINNAGVSVLGSVEQLSIEDIEWLMNINFWGMVYGVKFFLPILKEQPQARIVNLSSVFGLFAPWGQSAYSASKFAVRGFTESLRHELENTNIKVSTVHPGGIKTEIANSARIGKDANEETKKIEIQNFNRVAVTTSEKAAEIIVRGMLKGKPRILIGFDAFAIEGMVRLFPIHHWDFFKMRMGKREF